MSLASESPINHEFLARTCDDDDAFARELVDAFLTATPAVLEQIRMGVLSADPTVVRAGAHTLKGSSRAIGADRVGEVAETLETRAREADLTDAAELLGEAEARFAQVDAYARTHWSSTP